MESDVDSEGEDLEILRPTLIQELRNILDEYPDDGQILKELIQNAEDAGATKVKILTDNRLVNHHLESADIAKHPHLKFWQGPGLCVYNDAQFKDKDWDGIRMLHMSIKEKDPLKVGRFGLGFKSVFHMTDRLVILSGNSIMYMDPFKPEDRYCKKTRLAGKRGRELKSLLMCLEGVFGVTKETFSTESGGFPGTLFWFPLRQSGSELSSTVYSQAKVQKLISSFQAEAPSLLLFLNSINRVTVYTREDVCEPSKFFSVGLAASCRDQVCEQRMNFVTSIRQGGQDLPETGCYCQTELFMETVEFCADGSEHKETCRKSQHWAVALYHPGQQELSEELKQLCADPELSYKPLVGVAVPLSNHSSFQSQLFCFLPLPLETHSPTGLPVHVNGFFALSQNRRHLKWPSADQLSLTEQLDPPLRWNCLLVEELMPRVYGALLDRLRCLEEIDPQQMYCTWPDESSVDDRWKPLLRPLYNALCSQPSFYSHSQGGQWVNLNQAVLEELSQPILRQLVEEARDEEESIRVKESVAKVYSLNGEKLVQLPDHVHRTLDSLGFLQSIDIMTGERVRHLLHASFPHLSDDDRLRLLHFLCCHDNVLDLVQGHQLLPLADGTFATFHGPEEGRPVIRLCPDNLLNLFPGLEPQFCNSKVSPAVRKSLCMMASSGKFAFQTLEEDDADIPELIEKSLHIRFGDQQPSLPHDDIWIQRIWDFLTSKELGHYSHLNLLPEMRDDDFTLLPLSGIYVSSSVTGMAHLTTELTSCLPKLRVKVLPALPDFVTRHKDVLGRWVFFPSAEGLMAALKHVSDDCSLRQVAVDKFNATSSAEEKEALITLLVKNETESQHVLRLFQQLKLFTETTTGDAVSVEEVPVIAPDTLPPIMSQQRMLSCSHPQRLVASILGGRESTMLEVVTEVIRLIQPGTSHFSSTEIVALIKFALSHEELTNDASFIELIKCAELIPTSSGQLKLARDLYDPTSPQLKKMFLAEHKFPSDNFLEPGFLNVLKELGLRGEDTLDLDDIVRTSKMIEDLWVSEEKETAKEKAEGLLEILSYHGQRLDAETLDTISYSRCLPCEDDESRPSFYPGSLPYSPSPKLARPRDMCHSSQTQLIGSVLPVIKLNMPSAVAQGLQIDSQINKERVIQHLDNVVTHYQIHESSQYRLILGDIFHFLGQHVSDPAIVHAIHEKECVLLETGDGFAKPGAFWVEKREEDIQLKPYRFPLPSDMQNEKEFFLACDAVEHQDASLLYAVLLEIQTYHSQHTRSQTDFNRDFLIVEQILCELSKSDSAADGTVILPVFHSDPNVLHFHQAKNCTVLSSDGLFNVSSFTDDTDIFTVHERIHQDTAIALGALKMKDRALTGVEDLDFEYEQQEELTDRLHDLLMNSYTDGFSVPKELIQNADDAGATEVCFLLDERENEDARKNLIADTLDSFQGPAFWAYNNATFSDEDFENIKKLGAGTKKEDTSKVGRFGLGFNSVYNLTDVPSFISRHTMAMFDPHKKFLKERKAGLRMDFRRSVNRCLLSRMPNQFKPFQGVFGCELSNDDVDYNGTLFRFPLRTKEQAATSKIQNEIYDKSKRRQFLKMLLERAGNLLLFTQRVNKIKIFYLPPYCTDPSSPQCLLDLTKNSHQRVLQPDTLLGDQSVLQYFTSQWSTSTNIQILEDVRIEMKVTENATSVCEVEAHSSTTHWRLAWASGVAQSATLARQNRQEKLVPLAAVAAFIGENGLKAIEDSPPGYYKSGHVFCFMPLPEGMVLDNLLVHVNATFALSSSRRSLLSHSDDDLDNKGATYNAALIADAVSRAYLLLLENVQSEAAMDTDFKCFFKLWPISGEKDLVENFYRLMMTADNKVVPVPKQNTWIDVSDACFLEPNFRKSESGLTAWTILHDFWERDGCLVDVPAEIFMLLTGIKKENVISVREFYSDVFLPNIESNRLEAGDRDRLVLHALTELGDISTLISQYACIPCLSEKEISYEPMAAEKIANQNECFPLLLKRIGDLYDPTSVKLRKLFLTEKMFPSGEFVQPKILDILKRLGLNQERKIRSEDLIKTAKLIEQLWNHEQQDTALLKAEGLWDIVKNYGQNLGEGVLGTLSAIQCLPCAQQEERPELYPPSLPFCCTDKLVRPQEMCHSSQILLVGSQLPAMKEMQSSQDVAMQMNVGSKVYPELVLQHLHSVISHYESKDAKLYKFIFSEMFQFLGQYISNDFVVSTLRETKCVLTQYGDRFAKPGEFWVERMEDDIEVTPYRFLLPHDFLSQRHLFIACGSTSNQKRLLSGVLHDIQETHAEKEQGRPEFDRDINIVSQILNAMVKNQLADDSGSIPLPIYHSESNVLHFRQAKDCTLVPKDGLAYDSFFAEDEEFFIVHPDIRQDTAIALGALKMKDRALTGVEDLDFEYEQQEELTDRLHDLLMNSYTDGFSVPKELIQNADDAGATEVCFLLDERENEDARKNLIADTLDSFQGPAFWAYNNATFSDEDFENIKKLGAGTKKEDTSKVGRFGLGFNSVYNLTDVPSFISRHTMAMFDPHKRFLKEKKAGLRMDFRRSVNRSLLARMPSQFKPFQGVFGCELQSSGDVNYNGTLFRFPLRTVVQAGESKIKKESYSKGKRQEFLKMLLERAGSVLTFTQNVKTLKVFYLHSDCTDPSSPQCLLDLTKNSHQRVLHPETQLGDQSIMQYFTSQWSGSTNIQILEDVRIEMKVTENATSVCEVEAHSSTTDWRLAWASGVAQSATLARQMAQEGLVPLAAVAALTEAGVLQTAQNSPRGFYKSGHYFCFLPLPGSKENWTLPVHVNATFALKSSRRSMLTSTDEDLDNKGARWNSALVADAVSRAYLLLLENVQNETASDNDFKRFFQIWPVCGESLLLENFFRCLVNDGNKVFPVAQKNIHWADFKEVWFMDQQFRKSTCGNIAWQAMQHFWNRDGHLADIPAEVYSAFEHSEQKEKFKTRVITANVFYRDFFFPNIAHNYWQQQERDELVYYCLLQDELRHLLKEVSCIPCAETKNLKKPKELINPRGDASKLYSLSDSCFPQGRLTKENSQSNVDFCSESSLKCLLELGMITDELPPEMLLERATSVSSQLAGSATSAHQRAKELIVYLSAYTGKTFRIKNYPEDVIDKMSAIEFLPVLRKPSEWPFPWASQDVSQLAAPCELYLESFANLVGCHKLVVDSKALGITFHSLSKINVLKLLKLVTEEHLTTELFKLSVQQLQTVAISTNQNPGNQTDLTQGVCRHIYSYLTKYLEHDKETEIEQLSQKDVVWTNTGFVKPSQVAVYLDFECQPYRFKLETGFCGQCLPFLQAIGVKDTFDAANLASVIGEVYTEFIERQLPDETIDLISRTAQMLAKSLESSGCLTESPIYLPDRHNYMNPTRNLCLDDCEWLKESENMKFVSDKIPNETAKKLGVKSKRSKDFESLVDFIPFGQNEKLTDRIKRLLEGYTLDSSLFKELLQNADDAGATEIRFIKDWRHLGNKKLLEGCEKLQGPALCVFNDKSFTKKDMEGIQSLGQGSKGQDALKIGQFGVGFNAVYHITDAPSFWTLEDDKRETICIFDPNCRYFPNMPPDKPGLQLQNIERIRDAYPDMIAGYLDTAFDMTQPGTLFRFPLRTEEMAKYSDIKKEAVSEKHMHELLEDFQKDMSFCLLFLNNLRKIGIYSVKEDGCLLLENEVSMNTHGRSVAQDEHFKKRLKKVSKNVRDKTTSLLDIDAAETRSMKTVHTSNDLKEEWLVVQRVGFERAKNYSEELQHEWQDHFQLLPRGGVAVKLAEISKGEEQVARSQSKCQAFCILPLPVITNLPMHVNGHFALDHETRRNLWDCKGDTKTEWNELIACEVIVPAYLSALQFFRDEKFCPSKDLEAANFWKKLQLYHNLFPNLDLETASAPLWTGMRKKLYKQIAERELPIFPVLCPGQNCSLHWVPAACVDGFAGYFNNLEKFFLNVLDIPKEVNPVVLTQGGVHQTTDKRKDEQWAKQKADELKVLLKEANMQVLETPYRVFENFQKSGVQNVSDISPETAAHFLRSARSQKRGRCTVDSLPQPVTSSPLKTPSNVKTLLHFLHYQPSLLSDLEGLPLCLRQSGKLCFFEESDDNSKPIVSVYFNLLVRSGDMFISSDIMHYFLPLPDKLQKWMKTLDIPTLVRLLPLTLPEYCFKTGHPVQLEKKKFPSTDWLRDLWLFLGSNLIGREMKDTEDVDKLAETELKDLMNWNLIPVKNRDLDEGTVELYPLKSMHKVVFLPAKPGQSNRAIWDALKTKPLPFLDTSLISNSKVVKFLVASINRPLALLEALIACISSLQFRVDEAKILLTYFMTNLIKEKESSVVDMLKSLPLYMGIDGNLRAICPGMEVLCIAANVANGGLIEWAANQRLLLLKKEHLEEHLREYLDLKAPTTPYFYERYLLPTLQNLPGYAIPDHMLVIKRGLEYWNDQGWDSIVEQLKITPFIVVHDERRKACTFYSPHHPVFRVMVLPDDFPPEPYCHSFWKSFMQSAGMISGISQTLFLRFAEELENEGRSSLTDNTIKKSESLVSHFFSRRDLDGQFLQQLSNIRFLRPSEWEKTEEGKVLIQIVRPFCTNRLISFSESCREEHRHLVWSSCCIVHPTADPNRQSDKLCSSRTSNGLGLQEIAEKYKVIMHLETVCSTLDGPLGQTIFENPDYSDVMKEVMQTLYTYLQKHVAGEDIPTLKCVAIICDVENKQMLKAESVVFDLMEEDAIPGYLVKFPQYFGQFSDFFQKLGVAERATANHYSMVLSRMKEDAADSLLHVEEMKLVQKAVQGLFKCLESENKNIKRLTVGDVYLPSGEKRLVKSTELVFVDNPALRRRIPVMPLDIRFFLGFESLEIDCFLPQKIMRLLPKEHELQFLSQLMKEIIPDEVKRHSEEGRYSRNIVSKLTNPDFVEVVVRLAFNHSSSKQQFSETTANQIEQSLSNISVLETADLKTVLLWKQRVLNDTEHPKKSFVEKRSGGSRSCVVYLDRQTCDTGGIKTPPSVVKSCRIAVIHAIGIGINASYLELALDSPSDAKEQMDDEGLEQCNFNVNTNNLNKTIYPPPGTFIPPDLHCYLDNTFGSFYIGEHIGFEVYDPQVEGYDTNENDPVYVYGIVVEEICQEGEIIELARRFRIDIGLERGGNVEVSVTQMYKFYRNPSLGTSAPNQGTPGPVVVYEGRPAPEGTPTSEMPAAPGFNFKTVMKEIRRVLTEAWETLDEQGKKRVVKRLYLQWHPDKNRGNEEFCTRVVQRLQQYVCLLKEGKRLPEDDDDDRNGRSEGSTFRSSSPQDFYASFFENMHRRGRAYDNFFRTNSESSSSSGRHREHNFESFHSENYRTQANPQPGEGRRWFKQAEEDLSSALASDGSYAKGHNWVCYQCHQATEKALKAVLYFKNANSSCLRSHELSLLASETGNDQLERLALKLERKVGNHMRMRYPDLLAYPTIPADAYSADHASEAFRLADSVINIVRSVLLM